MDLVLGLSMTPSSARWVLVEGTTGDGATLNRGARALQDFDAGALLDSLMADAAPRRVHAVGLTWAAAAESAASEVWQALTDRGVENVIAVSDIEAAEALALGIAEMAACERVAVCVAEPGPSVLAAVTPDGVTADRVDFFDVGDVEVVGPDAVFVLGSGDVAGVVSALQQRTDVPVVSAEQADLALARGAALASASAVAMLDAQQQDGRGARLSPTALLASVLAAAVVTLVVSVSAAVGLSLTPETPSPQMVRSVQEPVREAAPPPAEVLPPSPAAPPPAPAAPVVNEMPAPEAVEVPAPAAPPVYDEPIAPAPEYVPPAPDYVPPPAPPNYLPPAPGAPILVQPGGPLPAAVPPPVTVDAQQPRLRDRIIERIPIINRFHEPQYNP
ncbi:hypothetical protein MJO55_04050 [Mycolicibacterium rufum]|uniref:FHA domain-containing protein n=2 Tax=Mycolicibacterium rufum TaxID=318424 RepID=A0ABY3UDB6_9MYCO|nr:hypothetical protein [Mycolicibacterium rufum]KGI66802.1 hypothetical protein EU78_04230 [Mycolicibacterium rufum]ULP37616.1 hypothetical protein MJO55_04050 [Mycolicibacterium rufum]